MDKPLCRCVVLGLWAFGVGKGCSVSGLGFWVSGLAMRRVGLGLWGAGLDMLGSGTGCGTGSFGPGAAGIYGSIIGPILHKYTI